MLELPNSFAKTQRKSDKFQINTVSENKNDRQSKISLAVHLVQKPLGSSVLGVIVQELAVTEVIKLEWSDVMSPDLSVLAEEVVILILHKLLSTMENVNKPLDSINRWKDESVTELLVQINGELEVGVVAVLVAAKVLKGDKSFVELAEVTVKLIVKVSVFFQIY